MEARLYEVAQSFRALLDMSRDGFIVVDRQGTIAEVNQVYATFLGSTREELIGSLITKFIPTSEMLQVMEQNRTDLDSVQALNNVGITPDSKDHIILVSRCPVTNAQGDIIGAVAHVKFRNQVGRENAVLEELYSQLDSYDDDIYRMAMERFSKAWKDPYATVLQGDRQALLLQYYQEEIRKATATSQGQIIGESEGFRQITERALRVAKTGFSVLITGETGTGKEVIADLIHENSDRQGQPFVKINCAAIPFELLESELFGYRSGAFTGARKGGQQGKFEVADGGSIFLDEIGDMPLHMQAKMLRVLQSGEIEPIGASAPVKVDVRIISATRMNVAQMVQEGKFREDLYYRLNEVGIHMLKLSERVEDIRPLARYMLDEINAKYRTHLVLDETVLLAFEGYTWPGNIRELNNVIKNCYSVAEGQHIILEHLPSYISAGLSNSSEMRTKTLKERTDYLEKAIIQSTLRKTKYNLIQSAELLGLHRSNLYKKLEKYGIDLKQLRQEDGNH